MTLVSRRSSVAVCLTLVVAAAGCGDDATPQPTHAPTFAPTASPTAAPTATPTPAASPSPTVVPTPTVTPVPESPVVGVVVAIDSAGLANVKGFTLRLAEGAQVAFVIGTLENGAEFPPGHLTEHLVSAEPVRVSFRVAGGQLVVYRIEDAG